MILETHRIALGILNANFTLTQAIAKIYTDNPSLHGVSIVGAFSFTDTNNDQYVDLIFQKLT